MPTTVCTFWNVLAPPADWAYDNAPAGVDLFLAMPPSVATPRGPLELILPWVCATNCDSKSVQLLDTFRGSYSGAVPRRSSVLLGVRHGNFNVAPPPPGTRGALPVPPLTDGTPSVIWGDTGDLILTGCTLRGVRVAGFGTTQAELEVAGSYPGPTFAGDTSRVFECEVYSYPGARYG